MNARSAPAGGAFTINPHGITGTPATITARRLDHPWLDLNTTLDNDETFVQDVFAAIRDTIAGWQPGGGMSIDVHSNNTTRIADLAVAVAVLRLTGDITPYDPATPVTFLGRLRDDGGIGSTVGIRAAVSAAVDSGMTTLVVPSLNRAEAEAVPGTHVIAVSNLSEVIAYLNNGTTPRTRYTSPGIGAMPSGIVDMADLPADHRLRRVLEVAAAGAHSLSVRGTSAAGVARRLAGILPMSPRQHDEASRIQSVIGILAAYGGPGIDHTPMGHISESTTFEQIFGQFPDGSVLPGQVSMAHAGVLSITSDTPHLSHVADALRRGEVVWRHHDQTHRLPAAPQCIVADKPSILSPRIAIRQDLTDLPTEPHDGETSTVVAAQIRAARQTALDRWKLPNGHIPLSVLRSRSWRLPPSVTFIPDAFVETGCLSLRAHSQALRIAWTLADLDGSTTPTALHVEEALYLRGLAETGDAS